MRIISLGTVLYVRITKVQYYGKDTKFNNEYYGFK